MNLAELSILQLSKLWQTGELSAVEIAQLTLDAIAAQNPRLNAWTEITEQRIRQEASQLDKRRQQSQDCGPLAAIPYGVKNLFDVQDHTTLAGAELFAQQPPARADAWAIQRLQGAGAMLSGMLNMDAYAYGFTTENSYYGPCHNPLDETRIAGGSSGGSASAVAAGLVHFSLGSDTNGSIRVPASLCGIFGLKPTFGRLSRQGTHPFVASLDHIGPLARSSSDLALVYDVLQGHDPSDSFQAIRSIEPVAATLGQRRKPLRVAILGDYFQQLADPQAQRAVAKVAKAFTDPQPLVLPQADIARSAAFLMTASEGGSHYLPQLREQPQRFEPNSRERLVAGCMLPASWYLQAQRFRRQFSQQVLPWFEQFDLMIAAATPCTATPIGQQQMEINQQSFNVKAAMGMLAQPFSFLGTPVATVPIDTGDRLPIGVQLIAAPFREDLVLEGAWQLEQQGITFSTLGKSR